MTDAAVAPCYRTGPDSAVAQPGRVRGRGRRRCSCPAFRRRLFAGGDLASRVAQACSALASGGGGFLPPLPLIGWSPSPHSSPHIPSRGGGGSGGVSLPFSCSSWGGVA